MVVSNKKKLGGRGCSVSTSLNGFLAHGTSAIKRPQGSACVLMWLSSGWEISLRSFAAPVRCSRHQGPLRHAQLCESSPKSWPSEPPALGTSGFEKGAAVGKLQDIFLWWDGASSAILCYLKFQFWCEDFTECYYQEKAKVKSKTKFND